MGGKMDGKRVASCQEYLPKANILVESEIQLTAPKSGFGTV